MTASTDRPSDSLWVAGSDLTVPAPLDDADIAEPDGAGAKGFAHVVFGRGLALVQRGRHADALPLLRRADDLGHPEAALLLSQVLAAGGDADGARGALDRADRRGSMWAPFLLAMRAQQEGDEQTAARLRDLAVLRAGAADHADSADASYLMAIVALSGGNRTKALPLLRRATERGSAYAAYVLAQLAARRGDLEEATEAAERCAVWGMTAPTLLLGDLWYQRHRFSRARRAWRAARDLAERQDDPATRDAASARLHPGPVRWARSHPVATGAAIVAVVVATLVGGAPWGLAAVGWLAVALVTFATHRLGDRIRVGDDTGPIGTMPALSAGNLTVAGGVVGGHLSPWALDESVAPPLRATTDRDRSYLRVLPALVGLLAAAMTAWAAGLVTGSVIVRVLSGWLAVATLWQTAWRAPDVLKWTPRDEPAPPPPGGVQVVVRIGLSRFFSFTLRTAVTGQHLGSVVEAVREASIADCPVGRLWRRASPWLSLLGSLAAAAFFAAEAVAPDQQSLARLAVTVLATAVPGIGALRALEELAHGAFRGAWGSVLTGAGKVVLIAVLVLVAHWTGLLDSWRETWASVQ